jgi:hypothetical protein
MDPQKESPPALPGAERARSETRGEAISEPENIVVSSNGKRDAETNPVFGPSSETSSKNGAEPTDEKAKPNGGGPPARKTKKANQEESTEPLPDEAQPAPEMPKAERTEEDYDTDDILADDSDTEDELSEPAPEIPRLVDKLPQSDYIQVRGGKGSLTQIYAHKLEEKYQRPGELRSYILTKKMNKYFIRELNKTPTKMNVCDVCTLTGEQFMYMFPASSGLSGNSWNVSRGRLLLVATKEWVLVSTDMEKREYTYRKRRANLPSVKPKYPESPILQRVRQAVQGPRLVATEDHPIVKRLLGIVDEDSGDNGLEGDTGELDE